MGEIRRCRRNDDPVVAPTTTSRCVQEESPFLVREREALFERLQTEINETLSGSETQKSHHLQAKQYRIQGKLSSCSRRSASVDQDKHRPTRS